MAKLDALKENLHKFYTTHEHLSRKEIFDRFIAIGAPERSFNRWLSNLEQNKIRIVKKAYLFFLEQLCVFLKCSHTSQATLNHHQQLLQLLLHLVQLRLLRLLLYH